MNLPTIKYRFFSQQLEAQKFFEEKDVMEQHPTMYSSKPGLRTRREYAGLKQNLLWQGMYSEQYFKTRPYVVVWFER